MPGHTYASVGEAERALFEMARKRPAAGKRIDAYRVMPVAMTDAEEAPGHGEGLSEGE